jgi:hypothetical protein
MSRVSGSACDPQRQPEVMRVYGQEWWMQIVMHANHRAPQALQLFCTVDNSTSCHMWPTSEFAPCICIALT